MINRRQALCGIAASALFPTFAKADQYPSRLIQLIVGYPAGGAIDLTARALAEGLSKEVKQNVVVDNRAGANGQIGLEAVFRASPDGYVLALAGASNVTAGAHLRPLTFNALDMEHVTRLVKAPLTLAVKKDLPVSNVAEFIELAKKKELTFASAGVGSSHHLTGELFRIRTGTKLLHVPYKGSGPAVQDLVAGVVDAAFGDPTLVTNWRSGQVKVLGASSDGRWALNPDVPPIKDTVPDFVSENWYGLSAPPKTPDNIVRYLFEKTASAMKEGAIAKRLSVAGLEVAIMEPGAFKDYVRKDSALWKSVIEQSNIKLPG